MSLGECQLPSPKTHPNLSLPGPPVEVAFGPIAIGLAVVAFQAMLLGGLGRTSGRREGCEKDSKGEEEHFILIATKPQETRQLILTLPFSSGLSVCSPDPFLSHSSASYVPLTANGRGC